ncbi:MAG: hypothetical protein HQL76_08985, partial [Magnetococcales bacterium]|nr:hypothetical protein [Magnetococcales bacterium]
TTGNLAMSGSDLTWNGTTVASITSNSGGTLALQFNGNATTAMVASVMQNITYSNASEDPGSQVLIDWTFSDGSVIVQGSPVAQSTTYSQTIFITAVNDPPQIDSSAIGKKTWIEGGDAISLIPSDFVLSDADDPLLSGATITIGNVQESDVLAVSVLGTTIVASFDDQLGVLNLEGTATPDHYAAVLRTLTFQSNAANPVETGRNLALWVSDGTGSSTSVSWEVGILRTTGSDSLGNSVALPSEPDVPTVENKPTTPDVPVAEPPSATPTEPESQPASRDTTTTAPLETDVENPSADPVPADPSADPVVAPIVLPAPVPVAPTVVVSSSVPATSATTAVTTSPTVATTTSTSVAAPSSTATASAPSLASAATQAPAAPMVEAAAPSAAVDGGSAASEGAAADGAGDSGGSGASAGDSGGGASGGEGQVQPQGAGSNQGAAGSRGSANSGSGSASSGAGAVNSSDTSQGDSDMMFPHEEKESEGRSVVQGFGGGGFGGTVAEGFGSADTEMKPTEGFGGSAESTRRVEGFGAASDGGKGPRPEGFGDSSDRVASDGDVGYLDQEEEEDSVRQPIDVSEIDPYSDEAVRNDSGADANDRLEVTPYGDETVAEGTAAEDQDGEDEEGEKEMEPEPPGRGKSGFTMQLRAAAFGNSHLERMMMLKRLIEQGAEQGQEAFVPRKIL